MSDGGRDPKTLAIGIVGAGRLGTSLAKALDVAGYRLAAVASRSASPAAALVEQLSECAQRPAEDLVLECDMVFVTVGDSEIAPLVSELPWREGQRAVHCSGALGLEVLDGAARRGARVGCLHPLQVFPSREGDAGRFQDVVCGVEGPDDLGDLLERVASDLGARVVRLEGADRALYHAAAVLASNYAVSLMSAATRAWGRAGLPAQEARDALAPLLLGAAQGIARHPLPEALTGPVARGDVDTVRRHLDALRSDSTLRDLYRRLGVELLELDLPIGALASRQLREVLAGAGEDTA